MNAVQHTLYKTLGSIRTRIALSAVAALVIGIGATTFVLVRQAERDTLASQREREQGEAVRAAASLAHGAVGLQRAMVATAAIMSPSTLADDAALKQFVQAQSVLRGLFSSVLVADAAGRVRVLADARGITSPALDIGDRHYFKQTIAEQRPVISEAILSRLTQQPLIIFSAPLVHEGKSYGAVAATLHLANRDLLEDVVQSPDDYSDSLQIVTDATGLILAHPDRSRLLQSLDTEPRMAQGFARWKEAGEPVEPSGLLVAQPGEVLAVAGVPGPNWVLWRALPESELLAPLNAARKQALLWATAIVATASLVVFGLIDWLLRPLLLLKRRALHLFDGHEIDAGWPRASGEIGELVRVLRHVGAERRQLESLKTEVLTRLGSVMAAAPVGIMFTRDGRFELVSAEFCRIFGRHESDFLGRGSDTIMAEAADVARLDEAVGAAFAERLAYRGEWPMRRADDTVFWARLRGQSVDRDHAAAGIIWTLTDVSDQRAARQELEWSAGHDALTGLANRKLFERRLNAAWEGRPASMPAALIMIDLDRFKPINDSAGHAVGDAMLKAVAETITAQIRSADLAARLGGDEFGLLLEHCPPDAAERVAQEVRRAIAAIELPWQGRTLRVGASLGLAVLTADTHDVAAWLQAADTACYEAKAGGRDTVRVAGVGGIEAGLHAPESGDALGYTI